MLIAALVSPVSSSASYTVTASRARWSRFMLMIASRIDCAIPAARSAANDEPYSTSRARSRSYQTRCGMWCTSGCAPVASDDRHTGVSDGNVDTARAYLPCSARNDNAGARPSSTAASKTDGVSPSITIRMAFLVARKRAQPCIALGCTAAQARREGRHQCRLEVARDRDPRDRRKCERRESEEHRHPEARAAAAHRPRRELRRADRAEHAADAAAERLVPLSEREADRDADPCREHECGRQRDPRAGEDRPQQHADRNAQSRAHADPIPGAHLQAV